MAERPQDQKADAMYALYLQGATVRMVGAAFGVANSTVTKVFAQRGFPARRPTPRPYIRFKDNKYAIGKNGYYATTHGTPRRYLHRDVWEAANGPIPPGCQIHHRNGDKTDYRLENLALTQDRAYHFVHHRRSPSVRRKPDEPNPTVVCACGCGCSFPRFDEDGRPRRYVWGHGRLKRHRTARQVQGAQIGLAMLLQKQENPRAEAPVVCRNDAEGVPVSGQGDAKHRETAEVAI